jgi:hypothetical protein
MENEKQEEGVVKTLFNASMAKLQRLDAIKKAIHEAALNGDLKNWFILLIEYNNELWEKMDIEERKTYSMRGAYITTLRNKFAKAEQNIRGNLDVEARNEFFLELNDYFRKLSEIESKYGMSMINQEDDSLGDGEF